MSIFLDFDGTITTEDTISELADFALRFQRERGGGGDGAGAGTGPDLKPQWDALVRAYADDRRAQAAAYRPAAPDRRTPADEAAFLRASKPVEARSLARVRACALFRGIGPDALRAAGAAGAVRLRPGLADFVARRAREGWRLYVVSVNWSAAFIEGACGSGFGEGVEVKVKVLANEVREVDGAVVGPEILNRGGGGEGGGEGTRTLTNSCDKLEVMRAVLREEEEEGGLKDRPSVYFGDSTTDLECLLEASRGIVIADAEDSPLLQTLRRIGRDVPRVREAGSSLAEGGLAWAADFEEVMAHVDFTLE
ncbi:haloacid dehalogenase-like hydrolase-domain-containing protein [Biscogniauxia mediterranea]|nr:haloacid dehalogenase-like hydrolase-domain-containing protein [Biscogniauxia mediterranea]